MLSKDVKRVITPVGTTWYHMLRYNGTTLPRAAQYSEYSIPGARNGLINVISGLAGSDQVERLQNSEPLSNSVGHFARIWYGVVDFGMCISVDWVK